MNSSPLDNNFSTVLLNLDFYIFQREVIDQKFSNCQNNIPLIPNKN